MVDFASCVDDLPVIGDEAFCEGFAGCGNPAGLRPTAENLNAILQKIQQAGDNELLGLSIAGSNLSLTVDGTIVDTVALPGGGGGGGGFFTGFITQYFGTVLSIPAGWLLCDGTGGTPDLRGKMVLGAGGAYAVGAQGGAETHDHGGVTGDTVLDASTMPAHRHLTMLPGTYTGAGASKFNAPFAASNSGGDQEYSLDFGAAEPSVSRTSLPVDINSNSLGPGGDPHNHDISTDDNMPPYYALLFIMKT